MSGESAGERWSPVQRVESVLLSIISLLDDAETGSPANVDAGVLLRKDVGRYRARVREDVEASKKDIPAGFEMPTHESTMPKAPEKMVDDREFWVDSETEEEGFGGSDTDEGEDEDDDDDEEGMDQEEVEMMEDREDEDEGGEEEQECEDEEKEDVKHPEK